MLLIQLNMSGFDAILEMGWLARNHAIVDCNGKSVTLKAYRSVLSRRRARTKFSREIRSLCLSGVEDDENGE